MGWGRPPAEARRRAAFDHVALSGTDPNVIAIAADHAVEGEKLPVFGLDDVEGIADFIARSVGLSKPLLRAP